MRKIPDVVVRSLAGVLRGSVLAALVLGGAAPAAAVRAQTTAYAEIVSVDPEAFPEISALLDVYNGEGSFVSGLEPADLTATEDGEARPVETLIESALPVQLVVAVNPGPALAVRNGEGIARFDLIVEALREWADRQPDDSQDDLSLVSLSGSLISHARVNEWFVSLESFKPDFRNTTPNLQTLSIALDTANTSVPQAGMKRAILFITPHMDDPNIENTLAPLIEQAVSSRVRVFVWFVDGAEYFTSASANAFKSLALQSGGSFFSFSGPETFPDLDEALDPLRRTYVLTYTSSLTTSGSHSLVIEADAPAGNLTTPEAGFSLDVQPPNPIFVSPPLQITRQPPAEDPYAEALLPAERTIEIIVEFPDGHPRPLKRTALYVDGQVVDENTAEPFESFLWDLTAYEQSGQHEIIVEAEDSLGLQKSSMGIPVTLTVIQPPRGIQGLLARYRDYLVLGAIGLAGLALFVILLRGQSGGGLLMRRRQRRKHFEDPVTQPVAALTESSVSATRKSKTQPRRAGWLASGPDRVADAPAYLIRLTNGGEPASTTPIPVNEADMTFGTDPVQSMKVLDDASVSGLHARIKKSEDGGFMIYDHGSVAGTWVNYEPVPRDGRRLTHGDRIHFGKLSYRFDLKQPPMEPAPKVISRKKVS